MICPECSVERKINDFFGKERCYKCIYKEKTKNVKVVKKEKFLCYICDDVLPFGRRKYCSERCVKKANDIHNKTYWTRTLNIMNVQWD
jgi:hypothetical protein